MRLHEIENKRELNVNFEKIWNKIIETQCSEIIDIYKQTNRFLYRGAKNHKEIYRGSSLEDRTPKNSTKSISNIFDLYLKDIGISALRSNSTFAVSNKMHALNFGNLYIIFPINGFEFSYTKHYDLNLNDWDELISLTSPIRKYIDVDNFDSIDEMLETLKELRPNDKSVQNLTAKDVLMSKQEFINFNKPSNTNLPYAIHKELEVLIKGRYYAFRTSYYETLIKNKLGMI